MYRVLQFLTLLVLCLIPLGGLYFVYPGLKFEIGSVSPFVLIIAAFCIYGGVFKKTWLNRYGSFLRQILARALNLRPRAALAFVAVIGAGLFLADLFRFWSFNNSLYDMVYTHSVMFYPRFDGHWGHCSLSPLRSFFVDHFAPTMLLGSWVVGWTRSSEAVILLQSLLVIGGTWLLVTQGPLKDKTKLWFLAIFVLLCQRGLIRPGIDLREEHFAFFSLCLAIVGLYRGMLPLYFAGLLALMGAKEHTPFLALGLVFPILWDPELRFRPVQRKVLAAATITLCLSYGAYLFSHVIPTLQAPTGVVISQITHRLPQLGSSLSEIALSPLLKPVAFMSWVADRLLDRSSLRYLAFLLIPGILFVLPKKGHAAARPWTWILAASIGIAANIIPTRPEQRSFHWHYELAFAPFLLTAILAGMRRMPRLRYWKWGLALAILFSMRWPAFEAWKTRPTLAQLSDIAAFKKIDCSQTIGADMFALSVLTHCPRLQLLSIQDCPDPAAAPALLDALLTHPGPPGVPGETLRGAEAILLDRNRHCQQVLEKRALSGVAGRGQLVWEAPSGRYALYRLKALASANEAE
ncbi:MAG: hypothetical protein ACK5QT_03350 [Oligoflexia bacterium]